jgi:gliding motility-associated-like protein
MKEKLLLFSPFFFYTVFTFTVIAQPIAQYEQFNGRYDYVAIGNTLNVNENNGGTCTILTQSKATLNLDPGQNVEAAYLFWAGSSATGDFDVELNGIPLTATDTFTSFFFDTSKPFFGAFIDVTDLVIANGNGDYTFSEMDITGDIAPYCSNGVNFGGWAIIIIYEQASLPFNQVSVYIGFESVYFDNPLLEIQLQNLNVVTTDGAKIGFLAWEGDAQGAVNESLQINGTVISDPSLNPANNPFNSTNSFTGSSQLWNMDLDFYNIENEINVGDTTMDVALTSGQDGVIIHNIVVVLSSELPDATITIDGVDVLCGERYIEVGHTVYNLNSTGSLPSQTPISFYADGVLIGISATINDIPIDGSETNTINLNIPLEVGDSFELKAVVDDLGNGEGVVSETIETNNDFSVNVNLLDNPVAGSASTIIMCDLDNDGFATFFLPAAEAQVIGNQTNITLSYYESLSDAEAGINPITNPDAYVNIVSPVQTIFVRLFNNVSGCFITSGFLIEVKPADFIPFGLIDIETCAHENSDIGLSVDLTVQEPLILGDGNPSDYTISYHLQQIEAASGTNAIVNPLNYLTIENPQTIWVRLLNNTLNCIEIGSFQIQAYMRPIVNSPSEIPDYILCDEATTPGLARFDLTTKIPDITPINSNIMVEFFESQIDAESSQNALPLPFYTNLTSPQTIYVRVTDLLRGCVNYTHFQIKVVLSSPPHEIFNVEVTTGAFAKVHTIEATAMGDEIYRYQLDGGAYQSSGIFNNVSPGLHIVTISDIYGCGSINIQVIVIDYPLFFTPNNDGYNDRWNIIGFDNLEIKRIYVFDRYGKILKELNASSEGWDGTYNGRPLPSSDYWFTVEYREDGIEKKFRGHFTLKR